MYSLATDGDDVERLYAPRFILAEFPSYENFWLSNVVPLTERPNGIQFKPLPALQAMGRSEEHTWEAELHYSVVYHLARAHDLKKLRGVLDHHAFMEAVGRIFAAIDIAQELLGRRMVRSCFRGSKYANSETCMKARSVGACREQGTGVDKYRRYRNLLVHSAVLPGLVSAGLAMKAPIPEKLDKYRNWARVANSSGLMLDEPDFDFTNNIVLDLWTNALTYLEGEWQSTLIPTASVP